MTCINVAPSTDCGPTWAREPDPKWPQTQHTSARELPSGCCHYQETAPCVATNLYHHKHDCVQLARFLGLTSPAVTMELYANHVVEAGQIELGEATMDLFDELDVIEQER